VCLFLVYWCSFYWFLYLLPGTMLWLLYFLPKYSLYFCFYEIKLAFFKKKKSTMLTKTRNPKSLYIDILVSVKKLGLAPFFK
jgi:hypothetical protein